MKKIMFNDALGLTQAVLEGRKTQTRREIKCPRTRYGIEVAGFEVRRYNDGTIQIVNTDCEGEAIGALEPKYIIDEVVAIAQSYEDIAREYEAKSMYASAARIEVHYSHCPGWRNKMYVRADEMPHRIKITGIRVEKLQDISIMDIYKEGIALELTTHQACKAFVGLLKRIDSKMWERNPFVFVYEFELMD